MTQPNVTLVVTQRERFSATRRSFESLCANTRVPYKMIYVDAGSPRYVREFLDRESRARGFRIIRVDRFLSPNEARNIGFREVDTPYVAFVDNDVDFADGWLERLLECAEETGAWAVGPIYLQGRPEDEIVHQAGGLMHFLDTEHGKFLVEDHFFLKQRLGDVRAQLERRPVEMVEFHAILVRADVMRRLGPLDENLLSQYEHADLCLAICAAGGQVYLEPRAVVTYLLPILLWPKDFRLFLGRWSEAWNVSSMRHFQLKYGVCDGCETLASTYRWLNNHRRNPFRRFLKPVRGLFGNAAGEFIIGWLERLLAVPDDGRTRYRKADVPWVNGAVSNTERSG